MTRTATMVFALLLSAATPAWADVTAFLGANTTPANRQVRGIAVGVGLLFVGFEFEYANTIDDPTASAPSLKTGMVNVQLQTPFPLFGLQPYVTTGAGLYSEELGPQQETGFGLNTGGGVRVSLVGPVQLRVDYRVFVLGGGARNSPAHRDRKSTRLNSSHIQKSRMPSSA